MVIQAILLAAGESSRMGDCKALLDWFGRPLVVAQAESLLMGGVDEVIVVTGAYGDEVCDTVNDLADVKVVHNFSYLEGKATSIKVGLCALSDDCEAIVLLAVDQPRPAWVVSRVLDSHVETGALITSPRYGGHGGHPLAFHSDLRGELSLISEEREGVRELMRKYEDELNGVVFDSSVVRLDINTPDQYESAVERYSSLAGNIEVQRR